jgi:Spy/CpxP family protein refolding chaperone
MTLKNKTMKTLLAVIVTLSLYTFSASAQVERKPMGDHHGMKGGHMHARQHMMKELNLTEAQRSQMKDINKDFKTKMEDLKKQDNMTVKEFNSRKAALALERKNKVNALLTTEQKDKMEGMKKERQDKMKQMQTKHMDRMKAELNLSDDQSAKLKAKNEELGNKMMAIRNNSALTQDQKKDQMKALKEERKTYMESILTADQKKKMEEMKSKRMDKMNQKDVKKP